MYLKEKYKAARVTLLAIILFIVIDCLMLSITAEASLLFVVVTPQLAVACARLFFTGFQSFLMVFLFAVIPLLLNIICYLLSKDDYHWLIFPTIMMVIDFLVMMVFIYLYGFELIMLVHIVIEIAIIVYLIQGIIAGRKLGSSLKEKVAELENEQENIPTVQAYQYDKKFARKNGANKGWVIVVAVIGLPIGFFVDFVIIGFLATYYSISTTAILLIFSFILLAIVVSFVWIVIQLRPYTLAKNVQYFMLDEQLYRCCYQDVSTAEVLKECKVIKKNPSEFICQYLDQGKKRKLIIPNGYPHLEDILK